MLQISHSAELSRLYSTLFKICCFQKITYEQREKIEAIWKDADGLKDWYLAKNTEFFGNGKPSKQKKLSYTIISSPEPKAHKVGL